jgi:hypothetical protein
VLLGICATSRKVKGTNNLFALLGAVVRLIPSLVERARLARTLRDLVLLEVFGVDAFENQC